MAEEEWDLEPNDWSGRIAYTAKLATENALIWKDVFSDEPEARLDAALATHAARPWWSEQLLEPTAWFENEPDTAVAPADVFDTLAITTYFGASVVSVEETRDALLEAIADPEVDAFDYLYNLLATEGMESSIPNMAAIWTEQADLAEQYGLELTSYEGGQHVHHTWNIGLAPAERAELGDFMQEFVRSPQMAELYKELWDVWQEIGDGPFMQFTEIGRPDEQNSFGLYNGLEDSNPRADILTEINQETPWWEDRGGEHFQQGVIEYGDAGGNVLYGTNQEDYLIARDGNDVLVGGSGDDGLHGGAGSDIAVFAGARADYEIVQTENGGYDVVHADSVDSLIEIEYVAFADEMLLLEDLSVVTEADLQAPDLWTLLTSGQGVVEETPQEPLEEYIEEDLTLQ
jgi:hypothetical protein